MLTLALALALQGCPQRIRSPRRPRARRPRRSSCASAAGASSARGARASAATACRRTTARATARRRLGTFGIGPVVYGIDPDPGVAPPLPPARLRRLVGRGPALADLQHVPPRRLRHDAAFRRRQRGALAGRPSPTALFAVIEYNVAPVVPGPRLGDLPARRHRPARRTAASRCRAPQLSAPAGAIAARGDDPHPYCIISPFCIVLRVMRSAAILGCAGYSGQETLDRVLAHPGLELVALGSDSLAGQARVGARPAARTARCPRSSRTTRPRRAAPTCSFSASTTTPPPPSSRPPTPSSSTSPARTASSTTSSRAAGTAPRPARGATACPSSSRRGRR